MLIKRMAAFFLAATIGLTQAVCPASAVEKLSTGWMGEYETFIAWYAKQQGWDTEAGLSLSMMPFESGKNIVDNLAAYNWDMAAVGAVPALTEPLGDYLTIVAVATEESAANAVFARKGSPVLAAGGANPQYPDMHGSAATVQKLSVLVPRNTSAHYLLRHWLKGLGLSEKDVQLDYKDPASALSAFTGGVGDLVALWSPYTLEAESKGFAPVVTGKSSGLSQTVLLVANNQFLQNRPQQAEAFLRMYLRSQEAVQAMPEEQRAEAYRKFYKEWTGAELTKDMAVADIRQHGLFDLKAQLQLLEEKDGRSPLAASLQDVVEFCIATGDYSPTQQEKMRAFHVTDKLLKNIAAAQ